MAERAVATTKKPKVKQTCSNSCTQKIGFNSSGSPADMILQLQRTAGNKAVQELIKLGPLQAKCRSGLFDDFLKDGAVRGVEHVVAFPVIQHKHNLPSSTYDGKDLVQLKVENRSSNAAKTECDIKVHKDDATDFALHKSFRTEGTGEPKVVILNDEIRKNPCAFEALKEHENQHVRNGKQMCKNFKDCVDKHTSRFLGLGTSKISYEDFIKCHNENNGGHMKDCIADEKSAYEEGIKKAKKLVNEKRCEKEKKNLEKNIEYWESLKDNAPNCKK